MFGGPSQVSGGPSQVSGAPGQVLGGWALGGPAAARQAWEGRPGSLEKEAGGAEEGRIRGRLEI